MKVKTTLFCGLICLSAINSFWAQSDTLPGIQKIFPDNGDAGEPVASGAVSGVSVIGQLDEDVVLAEKILQRTQFGDCGIMTMSRECAGNAALAATGQHHPLVAGMLGEIVQVVERLSLLGGLGELAIGDRLGQSPVPFGPACEHQQVTALGIGYAVLRSS